MRGSAQRGSGRPAPLTAPRSLAGASRPVHPGGILAALNSQPKTPQCSDYIIPSARSFGKRNSVAR
jgi:hypothetical protein